MPTTNTEIQNAPLPRLIERGKNELLTLELFEEDNTAITINSGSVEVFRAGTSLISIAVSNLPGTQGQAALLSAVTTPLGLSNAMLEKWEIIKDGQAEPETILRSGYLVRHVNHAVITDTSLEDEYAGLRAIAGSGVTAFTGERRSAWRAIQRRLIAKGNFPQLILDDWALADVHTFESLLRIFRRFRQSIGDQLYRDLQREFQAKAEQAWSELKFKYDFDESGTISSEEQKAGTPVLWTS